MRLSSEPPSEPVKVRGVHYMLYATGREPVRFETSEAVLAAYEEVSNTHSDVEIRTVIETEDERRALAEEDIPVTELMDSDDPLERLLNAILRPQYAMRMSRAMVLKRLAGADDWSARTAETRYRNARREILAALTEYQENK